MLDKQAEKARGLAFARALQTAVRTGVMFSPQHPSSKRPIQQSFDLLVSLLKSLQKFTVGFVDHRVIINSILTTDANLRPLEQEFVKRGIGAVRFDIGLTLEAYKRVLDVLVAPAQTIEAAGGLEFFLRQNPLERARVIAAEKKDPDGDTDIEGDTAAYLKSNVVARPSGMPDLAGLELLIESTGHNEPPRWGDGGPEAILRFVNDSVQRAVVEERGDPRKSYAALAQMMHDLKPEFVLPTFPKERRQELQSMPAEQVAAEFMENAAFQWASKRITAVPAGAGTGAVEDEVVTVLMRSLYASEMAEALAQKLSYYFQQYALPKSIFEKLQEELRWISLPRAEKQDRLLKTTEFTSREIRRLTDHVRDLLKRSEAAPASEAASHFMTVVLSVAPAKLPPEVLSRAPELITDLAGVRSFTEATCKQLCHALADVRYSEFAHFQLVNAAFALSSRAALCENWDIVDQVAQKLYECAGENRERHARCCLAALNGVVPESAADRLIEILNVKNDAAIMNLAMRLIRTCGKSVAERFMVKLEEAKDAGQRMKLLRLLGRCGPSILELVHERLKSPTWYIARNACVLASELRDPELLDHIAALLDNSNQRVQDAAVNALLRSSDPRRLVVLAGSLHSLPRPLREKVLWELRFAKDKQTVEAIGQFIFRHSYGDSKSAMAAIEALAAIKDERTLDLLGAILCDDSFSEAVRRFALLALQKDASEYSRHLLDEITKVAPGNPILAHRSTAASKS